MGNEIVLATFFFFVNCCVKVKKVENCKCWILEIDFLAPEKEVCLAVLIATTAWQLLEFWRGPFYETETMRFFSSVFSVTE